DLEVCNGADDDCDGDTDEGVRNACGGCGPVPEEVCNDEDDDCDGGVDEDLFVNACVGCGPLPEALSLTWMVMTTSSTFSMSLATVPSSNMWDSSRVQYSALTALMSNTAFSSLNFSVAWAFPMDSRCCCKVVDIVAVFSFNFLMPSSRSLILTSMTPTPAIVVCWKSTSSSSNLANASA
ncbi:MAG: hypothetical protein QF464_24710, partial [Myxococcota bacterium]|nr:hypothetical protein [Myxococcota bacterium]